MMTLKEKAAHGEISEEVRFCAEREGVSAERLSEGVASGRVVIPWNRKNRLEKPCAIGEGLKTKINANLGTSKDAPDPEKELEKLRVALEAGADTIMDLSTGGPIDEVRKLIREHCPVPLGTVPIYQAAVEAVEVKHKAIVEMTVDEIFSAILKHAEDGVDFMTVHCGITREVLTRLENKERVLGVVSRGGSFIIEWMIYNNKENPLYENFDRLLEIAREYEVTLSLGDGIRPGCLADATDGPQIQELIILGELTQRAWEAGVQVMIEGPGHVPLNQIEANIKLEKRLCHGAPFYVLGPLPTDIAPGYDHIVGAIGGAIAAAAGADFLCYVTPAEHLRLPSVEDVKEGVIASKIAAHVADIAKGIPGAFEKDLAMARARAALDWEAQIKLSLDPEKARRYRIEGGASKSKACTMCGEYCAIKVFSRAQKILKGRS
ncbi:Hydroxymethylpyrimidine phosphate synthase ThiC [Thermosulfurimonas dismutans]|uniref:Phosphomethylpyrimidine synthase n=2 Tax=Thermosulfurimonas dismutans TaxID=999894 RepID=A0A179D6C4_9BACT|nr:phosphomethylpyrimidine synthase ThiC [Thermosulfurimonas dismutans]OAQ21513.1 Hydroxymethylpyrimidine phosphate synthase ThiC [Thermosulfurimonas dismutans]